MAVPICVCQDFQHIVASWPPQETLSRVRTPAPLSACALKARCAKADLTLYPRQPSHRGHAQRVAGGADLVGAARELLYPKPKTNNIKGAAHSASLAASTSSARRASAAASAAGRTFSSTAACRPASSSNASFAAAYSEDLRRRSRHGSLHGVVLLSRHV